MVFEAILQNIVTVYVGQVWILGIVLLGFFFMALLSLGIDFQSTALLSLPLTLTIVSSGLLSGKGWIGDAILVIVGLSYGFLFVKLINR